MKNFFVAVIILFISLASCTPKKTSLLTCDLSRTDYTETIQSTGTIKAVNSVTITAPTSWYYGNLSVGWIKPEGSRVEKGDTICILKCDELLKSLDDQKTKLETQKADFKKLEADNALNLAMLEARVKENQAGMSISQLDSIQVRYAPPIKKQLMALELEKSRVEERKLQKKFLAEKTIDETDVRQMKARIIQAENYVQMTGDKVKELIITAPLSGLLCRGESQGMMMMMSSEGTSTFDLGAYPQVGAAIFPEMGLMNLPDLTEMQVILEVQEVDYKRIEKGQKVKIIVDAAGKLETTGEIKVKSLAPKQDYSGQSKIKLYEVTVSIDSCHTRMPPGLSARCDILINQIKDTIVVPTMAIFERDSMKVVYVAENEKFRPVKVETGLSNSSQTIINKGLKGKETIALIEPPHNYLIKPKDTTHE